MNISLPFPDTMAALLAALEQAVEDAGPEAVAVILPDVERLRARLWLRAQFVTAATATPQDGQEKLLTVEETAGRLGFAKGYVYEMIRLGRLPAIREGKYVRVRASTLTEWIRAREGLDGGYTASIVSGRDGRGAQSPSGSDGRHPGRAGQQARRGPKHRRPVGTGRDGDPRTGGPAGKMPGVEGAPAEGA